MADITTAYQQLARRNTDLAIPPSVVQLDLPDSVVGGAINNQQMQYHMFPFDQSQHSFAIIEGETPRFGTGYTNFNKLYSLPLPSVIEDEHNLVYDHNFNFLSMIGQAAGLGATAAAARARGVGGAVALQFWLGTLGAAGRVLGAAGGIALNTFKTVTLAVPQFRTFALEWRLHPKTPQESVAIQRMLYSLKEGAHPALEIGGLLFTFPKIYLMYFTNGSEYLYKFKPAVLQSININYAGGNPVPAFYKNNDKTVPEGVLIRTSWIELELWTRENFTKSIDPATGIGNRDPFSAVAGTIRGGGDPAPPIPDIPAGPII